MRPTPHDVRRWFAQRIIAARAAACLTTLHADPNWRVRYTRGLALRTFGLLYYPTGEYIEVTLLRVGRLCHARVTTCEAATGAASASPAHPWAVTPPR